MFFVAFFIQTLALNFFPHENKFVSKIMCIINMSIVEQQIGIFLLCSSGVPVYSLVFASVVQAIIHIAIRALLFVSMNLFPSFGMLLWLVFVGCFILLLSFRWLFSSSHASSLYISIHIFPGVFWVCFLLKDDFLSKHTRTTKKSSASFFFGLLLILEIKFITKTKS